LTIAILKFAKDPLDASTALAGFFENGKFAHSTKWIPNAKSVVNKDAELIYESEAAMHHPVKGLLALRPPIP
jgi:hypothetical protein